MRENACVIRDDVRYIITVGVPIGITFMSKGEKCLPDISLVFLENITLQYTTRRVVLRRKYCLKNM